MNPKGHIGNTAHVGDRVKFFFGASESFADRPGWVNDTGVILEITRRYGKRHASGDLIRFYSEERQEMRHADASYIVEILEIGKGARHRWRNSVGLNAERQKAMSNICVTAKKGEWFGDFQSLMMQVIFTCHHLVLQSRIDFDKAYKLWMKTRVGVKALPRRYNDSNFFRGCQLVKVKPFKHWVMQNINKCLDTTKSCDFYADADNDENQRMFYEDLDFFSDEMDRLKNGSSDSEGDSELDAAMHLGSDYPDYIAEKSLMDDVVDPEEGSCYDEATIEVPLRDIEKEVAVDLGLVKDKPQLYDTEMSCRKDVIEKFLDNVEAPPLAIQKKGPGVFTMTYTEEKDPNGKAIRDHLTGWYEPLKDEKK